MMQQMQHRNNAINPITMDEIDANNKSQKTNKSLNKSHNTSVANLDDYIYELENRSDSKINSYPNKEPSDNEMCDEMSLLSQLAQKEKDLILAAELGKALLDRNEELSRANEKITEEYSHKLEVRNFPKFYFT
jgi:coiled-coil domain-containing protein 64